MLRSLVGSEMCIRDSGANMDSAQTGVTLHEMRRADGTQDIHLAADPNQAVLLGHAKHCPALHHNPDPTWVRRHEFMSVGVVGLVRQRVGVEWHVLVTRRPRSMRTFGGAWVMPGGAVDHGETLAQAAAREVAGQKVGVSGCMRLTSFR
eukprot:TRINITY_DN10600_c0_g1_i2.p1 TRINITY_DN10600_c0_g1~~TRINITY_DN10600_c0_g1_i2.p1  ORF type:complete len:149 (+),score=34.85 TRINITY_DN10600_c0_g1_i2:134-580(+)